MARQQFTPPPDLTGEEWRPVVGWEGVYEVSSHGRVKRIKRACRAIAGLILKTVSSKGYQLVKLCKNNEKPLSRSVHRLVCAAFHGPAPEDKPQVNHKDGKRGYNHKDNLEWVSGKENVRHALDTGLAVPFPGHTEQSRKIMSKIHKQRCADSPERLARGERHGMSKLTETSVSAILSVLDQNPRPTTVSIARQFGVSRNVIRGIRDNTLWRHVPRS